MAIFGKYFEFNGKSSESFGLTIVSFETIDSVPMGLERSVNIGEMNIFRQRPNHFGATYTAPLQFNVTVVKNPYTSEKKFFTRSEIGKINAWLTSPRFPKLFHMTEYNDDVEADEYVDYFVTVQNVESTFIQEVIGLKFTITCDSPFGYSEEKEEILSTSGKKYSIFNETDDLESYIYPVIEVTPKDKNDITITNITDNSSSITFNPTGANNTIYIDCQNLTIKNSIGTLIPLTDLNILDPQKIYWFKLLSGQNEISFSGNATIKIKYREYRKVGAY